MQRCDALSGPLYCLTIPAPLVPAFAVQIFTRRVHTCTANARANAPRHLHSTNDYSGFRLTHVHKATTHRPDRPQRTEWSTFVQSANEIFFPRWGTGCYAAGVKWEMGMTFSHPWHKVGLVPKVLQQHFCFYCAPTTRFVPMAASVKMPITNRASFHYPFVQNIQPSHNVCEVELHNRFLWGRFSPPPTLSFSEHCRWERLWVLQRFCRTRAEIKELQCPSHRNYACLCSRSWSRIGDAVSHRDTSSSRKSSSIFEHSWLDAPHFSMIFHPLCIIRTWGKPK